MKERTIDDIVKSGMWLNVPAFMPICLGLKNTDLIVFARIYHFASGNKNNLYEFDLIDLIMWSARDRATIYRSINSLKEKELIYTKLSKKKEILKVGINNEKIIELRKQTEEKNLKELRYINNHITVPSFAIKILKLSKANLLVFSLAWAFGMGENQRFFLKYNYISYLTNLSRQTILRAITDLEIKGLILRENLFIYMNVEKVNDLINEYTSNLNKKEKSDDIDMEMTEFTKKKMNTKRKSIENAAKPNRKKKSCIITNSTEPDWLPGYTDNILSKEKNNENWLDEYNI